MILYGKALILPGQTVSYLLYQFQAGSSSDILRGYSLYVSRTDERDLTPQIRLSAWKWKVNVWRTDWALTLNDLCLSEGTADLDGDSGSSNIYQMPCIINEAEGSASVCWQRCTCSLALSFHTYPGMLLIFPSHGLFGTSCGLYMLPSWCRPRCFCGEEPSRPSAAEAGSAFAASWVISRNAPQRNPLMQHRSVNTAGDGRHVQGNEAESHSAPYTSLC